PNDGPGSSGPNAPAHHRTGRGAAPFAPSAKVEGRLPTEVGGRSTGVRHKVMPNARSRKASMARLLKPRRRRTNSCVVESDRRALGPKLADSTASPATAPRP